MAGYNHGIRSTELATAVEQAKSIESAIGVVFGTAPVNLTKHPYDVTNVPLLISSYEEAVEKLGYSTDFQSYTLCSSIFCRFLNFNIGPVVYINVLDPQKHIETVQEKEVSVINKKILIEDKGILLDTIQVKAGSGETAYIKEEDYLSAFDELGNVIIAIPADSAINQSILKIAYTKIDPSQVTAADIIGGYDKETRKRTGLSCVTNVFSLLNKVPCHLLAPGWSQISTVAAMLTQKAKEINGLFHAIAITDLDTKELKDSERALEYKMKQGYEDEYNLACYPKLKIGEFEVYYSAMMDAVIANTDLENEGPYASPSNKKMPIRGICLEGGEEVSYDLDEANKWNAAGIVTALNMDGWRTWGNEMCCYPGNKDVKDRYIVSRRVYNYRDTAFKRTFFDKVDNPANYILIEDVVGGENKELAALAAKGKIAGGSLEFNRKDNPVEDIMEGSIKFKRILSPLTPAKEFVTETCFDPSLNLSALGGE